GRSLEQCCEDYCRLKGVHWWRGCRMRRFANVTLFFGAIVTLWQLMVASGRWSRMLLPSPLSVWEYLWSALLDGSLLEATAVMVRRPLTGYAIGLLIGLPLGLLISTSQTFTA